MDLEVKISMQDVTTKEKLFALYKPRVEILLEDMQTNLGIQIIVIYKEKENPSYFPSTKTANMNVLEKNMS